MYKLGGRRKLGRKSSHRKAVINNQVRSLIISGKVVTTTPKAKVLKANADSYISTLQQVDAKRLERDLFSYVKDEDMAKQLAKYLSTGPKVGMVKVGYRAGDNAQLSRVNLEGYSKMKVKKVEKKAKPKKEGKKKEEKKETPEDKAPVSSKPEKRKSKDEGLSKSLRNRFVSKERAKSRSGL